MCATLLVGYCGREDWWWLWCGCDFDFPCAQLPEWEWRQPEVNFAGSIPCSIKVEGVVKGFCFRSRGCVNHTEGPGVRA